jgi:C4-dicarboxylate-specific signal transduction histidine kinase
VADHSRRGSPGSNPAVLSLALVAVVFAVDLSLPLGVASAVPYTFAVLLALKAEKPWFGPAVAALCGVLTILKMGIVPERGTTELWKVIANRCLALFAVGMTTVLGVLRRRAEANRRLAEEKVREQLADLAHLSRLHTAGQLAAGLAHELNQPLAAVCLQADVATRLAAVEGPAAKAELAAALREVADQGHRAAEIVKTLRRMVNRTVPADDPVDLNDVVRTVAGLVRTPVGRAAIDLRLELADDPIRVRGDRTQLEQVVFNLLQNAIEAVAPGPGQRIVRIETAVNGEDVTVAVRDSGPGLGSGQSERVFERFYTTKPNGMGMGLAISRSIVEAHGGHLRADERAGPGATFVFALPAVGRE